MIKIFLKLFKRVIISFFFLYAYNLIVQPLGLIIPLNIFTVGAVTILGIPALIALIFIIVLIY